MKSKRGKHREHSPSLFLSAQSKRFFLVLRWVGIMLFHRLLRSQAIYLHEMRIVCNSNVVLSHCCSSNEAVSRRSSIKNPVFFWFHCNGLVNFSIAWKINPLEEMQPRSISIPPIANLHEEMGEMRRENAKKDERAELFYLCEDNLMSSALMVFLPSCLAMSTA